MSLLFHEALKVHAQREKLKSAKDILAETVIANKKKSESEVKLYGPMDNCACGKKVPVTTFPMMHSGVVQFPNNICPGCKEAEKLDRETARIICVRCRKVVARLKPVKEKNGFIYQAGRTYHSDACPECKPNLTESQIVEKVIYMRKTQTQRRVQ